MEKGQLNLLILPFKKTHPPILLLHALLRNPTVNDVHTRSRITNLGNLLRTRNNVNLKHPPRPKSLPVSNAVSTLRKHNVRHQIQRHGFRFIPARKRIRMGRHQENRPLIRIRSVSVRRTRIEKLQRGEDSTTVIGIRPRDAREVERTRNSGRENEEESDISERTRARVFVVDGCYEKFVIGTRDSFLFLVVSRAFVFGCRVGFDRRASGVTGERFLPEKSAEITEVPANVGICLSVCHSF